METIANFSEDVLIDSLSYKLGNSASYITDRKSSTFWPSGNNIYKPSSGTKTHGNRFRHSWDPISMLDRDSKTVDIGLVSPLTAHGYSN